MPKDALTYRDIYNAVHIGQYSSTGYVNELVGDILEKKKSLPSRILSAETTGERYIQDAISSAELRNDMSKARRAPVSYEPEVVTPDIELEKALDYSNIPSEKKYVDTAQEISDLTFGKIKPATTRGIIESGKMFLNTKDAEKDLSDVRKSWRRIDGTYKGPGWLGDVGDEESVTEKPISVSLDGKEILIPSIVPSSTPEEIRLIKEGKITPEITQKAVEFAKGRIAEGESPFKKWSEENPWINMPEATALPEVLPIVKELSYTIPEIVKKDTVPVISQFATAIGNYMIDVAPTEPMGLWDASRITKNFLNIPELPKDERVSDFQNWYNKKNLEVQEQKSKWEEGSMGSYISQAYQSIGMQMPAYAAGILAKNPNVALGIMYFTSAGNATQAYIDKGVPSDTAIAAGKLEGHFEWMTEVVPTGFLFKAMKHYPMKNLLKMSINDVGFEQINSGLQQVVQDVTTGTTPDSHSLELYKSTFISTIAQMGVMSGVATGVNKFNKIPASIKVINELNKERARIVEESHRRITQLNALGLVSEEDMIEQRQSIPDVTKTPWEAFKAISGAFLTKSDIGAIGDIEPLRGETEKKVSGLMKQRKKTGGLPYKKSLEKEFLDSLKPYIREILSSHMPVAETLEEREDVTKAYFEYLTGVESSTSDIYKTMFGDDYAEAINVFNSTANRYRISEEERIATDTFRHYFSEGLYDRPFYSIENLDESLPSNWSVQILARDGKWSSPKEVTYLQSTPDNHVISVNNTIQIVPKNNIAFVKNIGDTNLPTLSSEPVSAQMVDDNPQTLFVSADKNAKTFVNKALKKNVDNILTLDISPSDEYFTQNQININERLRQVKASLFKKKHHPQMEYNVTENTYNNIVKLLNTNQPAILYRRGVDAGDIVELNDPSGKSLLLRVEAVEYKNGVEVPYVYKKNKPVESKDSPIAKRKLFLRKVTTQPQVFTDIHSSVNIGRSLADKAPKTYQYLLDEIYKLKMFSDTLKGIRNNALTELWVDDETIKSTEYDIKETSIRKTISSITNEETIQRKVSVYEEAGVAPDGTVVYKTSAGLYDAHGKKYIDNRNKLQKVKSKINFYGTPKPWQQDDFVFGPSKFINAILNGHKQSVIVATKTAKGLEVDDIIDIDGGTKVAQVRITKIDRDLKKLLNLETNDRGYLTPSNTELSDDVTTTEGFTNIVRAKSGIDYTIPGSGVMKLFSGKNAPFAKVSATRIVFELLDKPTEKIETKEPGTTAEIRKPLTEKDFKELKKYEVTEVDRQYNFVYTKIVEAISQGRQKDLNDAVNYGVKLGLFPEEAAQSIIDNAITEVNEKPELKTFVHYATSLGAEMSSFEKRTEYTESYLPEIATQHGNTPSPGVKNVASTMYQDPDTAFLGETFTQVFPYAEGGREVLLSGSELRYHYIRHHDAVRNSLLEYKNSNGARGLSPKSELAASHFFMYPDLYREFGEGSLINEKLKRTIESDLEREKEIVPHDWVLATDEDMRLLDSDPTAVNRLRKEMAIEFSDEELKRQKEFTESVTEVSDSLLDTDITVDDIKEIGKPTSNFRKGERGSIAVMPPWLFKAVAKAFSSGKADQKSPLVKLALNMLPKQEAIKIVSEYFGGASESLKNYVERVREHNKVKVIRFEEEYEFKGKRYYIDTLNGEGDDYKILTCLVLVEENGKKELIDSFVYSGYLDFLPGEKSLNEIIKEHISKKSDPIYANADIISKWKERNHIEYDPEDIDKYNKVVLHQVGKYNYTDKEKMLNDMVSLDMFYVNGRPIPVQISAMSSDRVDINKGMSIVFIAENMTKDDIIYAGKADLYTSRPDPDLEEYDRLPTKLELIENNLSYLAKRDNKSPHDEIVVNLRPGNFMILGDMMDDPRIKEINSWVDKKPKVPTTKRFSSPFKMNTTSVPKGFSRGTIEVPFQDIAIRLVNFFKRLYGNKQFEKFSKEDLERLNMISAAIDKVNINIIDYLETASKMGLTIGEFLENMYTGQGLPNADKLAQWTMDNIVDPHIFEYIYQDSLEYLYNKAEDRAKTTTFVQRIADVTKERTEQAGEYVEYKANAFEHLLSTLTFFGEAPEQFKTEVSNLYASIRDLSVERAKIDSVLWKNLSREDKKTVVRIVTAKDNIARIRRYNLDKIGGKGLEYWVKVLSNIEHGSEYGKGLSEIDPKRTENIKNSVASWGAMTNVLFNNLKARGMAENVEHMSDYAPYYAFDPTLGISKKQIKSSLKRYLIMPEKLKEPAYNYLKEIHGTDKPRLLTPDMMTDFLVSVRHDMLVSESIKKICEIYDKKREVSDYERGQWGVDEYGNEFENPPVTNKVYQINGINYVVYSPVDYSFSFSVDPNSNREYKVGNARSYLIPEKIAGYLEEMTNTPGAVLRGMNAFVRLWKRSIIYTIFPSFNWNNAFGDFQIYMMTHPNKQKAFKEVTPAFMFAVKYFKEQAGKEVSYNSHERRLKDFVDRFKTIESSQMVTDLTALDDVNVLKHVAKMFNKVSTFRESILRVAVASYLVREIDYGRGEDIKKDYEFMHIEPSLNYIEFAGRVSQDAMINYIRQSPTYRKWISGCLLPWGHFYIQGSKLFYKWILKGNTPLERLSGFTAKSLIMSMPSVLASLWNQGFFAYLMGDEDEALKKKRQEMKLHRTIRNRFHLIFGDKVWAPQIIPDILLGSKIYSIIGNKMMQLASGEINPKQFVRDTLSEWAVTEAKSAVYLVNPLARWAVGVVEGKDPLDGVPVYPEFNRTRLETSEMYYYGARYFVKTMNTVFSSYVMSYDSKGLDTESAVKEAAKRFYGFEEIFGIKDIKRTPRRRIETGRHNYLLNRPGEVDITSLKQEKEMEMDAKLSTILREIESDWVRSGKPFKTWAREGNLVKFKPMMKDLFNGKINKMEVESINARIKRMAKDEKNIIRVLENKINTIGEDKPEAQKYKDLIYRLKLKLAVKNRETTKAVRGASEQIEKEIVEPEE